jgi:cold shock CspA family protein
MKGTVLQFDKNTGSGLIEDHRGAEFSFSRDQVASNEDIQTGDQVNFRPKGSKKGPVAAQIVPIRASTT